jgi:GT2 family glycosyltransferase
VIIPLYNKQHSIVRTLESVIKQEYGEFEIIVIDDGSTDRSLETVMSYAEQRKDARLRIISQRNGGVSRARNTGIHLARYAHIVFLDADDLWHTQFLTDISRLIERFPLAGAYCTGYLFRSEDHRQTIAKPAFTEQHEGDRLFNNFFHVAARGDLPVMASAVCIPKAMIDLVGLFPVDEVMGEDQDMWCRIALKAPIAYSPQARAIYCLDGENRACQSAPPAFECPYSQRLLEYIKQHDIKGSLKADMLSYTASHLLDLAARNIKAGKHVEARKLLNDKRTCLLPRRKLWNEVKYALTLLAGIGKTKRSACKLEGLS